MLSDESEIRQGVCYGMKELLENITRTQLADYLPDLLPTVQTALCDADSTVRAVQPDPVVQGHLGPGPGDGPTM